MYVCVIPTLGSITWSKWEFTPQGFDIINPFSGEANHKALNSLSSFKTKAKLLNLIHVKGGF